MAVKYITRRAEDKKWCVKNAKAEKATRVFSTQKEAIDYAKSLKSTTSIMVQSREGKFRKVSKWDGVKKAPTTAVKATVKATKKVSKATTNTAKKAVGKKPAQPKPTEEEISEEAKLKAIEELKAQNAALDAEIEKEKEITKTAELRAQEDKKAEEAKKVEEAKSNKKGKSTGKKVALALGILFFLAVIAVGTLFILDWKEVITFMDVIKK